MPSPGAAARRCREFQVCSALTPTAPKPSKPTGAIVTSYTCPAPAAKADPAPACNVRPSPRMSTPRPSCATPAGPVTLSPVPHTCAEVPSPSCRPPTPPHTSRPAPSIPGSVHNNRRTSGVVALNKTATNPSTRTRPEARPAPVSHHEPRQDSRRVRGRERTSSPTRPLPRHGPLPHAPPRAPDSCSRPPARRARTSLTHTVHRR